MPTYDAFFFDFDGTLGDTVEAWQMATSAALHREQIELTTDEIRSLAGTRLHDVMKRRGFPRERIDRTQQFMETFVCELLPKHARWKEGARKLLEAAGKRGPRAIITGSHTAAVDILHSCLGVRDSVDTIVSYDDVKEFKPNPEGLLLACERLNMPPQRVLYVGDQPCDKGAAAAAEMDFVLMRSSHTPADLRHEREVTSLNEMHAYLA